MKKITTIVMMALLLTACAGSEQEATGVETGDAIALTAAIGNGGATTRAVNQWSGYDAATLYTQFAADQRVGIIMPGALRAAGTALTNGDVVGATTTAATGNRVLTLDANCFWPHTATGEVTFRAYYPYAIAGAMTDDFVSAVSDAQGTADAPTLTSGASADLLYAQATAQRTAQAVPLNFQHRMAKVTVVLEKGSGISDTELTACTVTLGKVLRGFRMNRGTGAVTAITSGDGFISADVLTVKANANTIYGENYCLLPPGQPLLGRTVTITLPSGRQMAFDIPQGDGDGDGSDDDVTLTAGKNYRYTMVVNNNAIRLQSLVIAPWETALDDDAALNTTDYSHQPLTFEPLAAGATVSYSGPGYYYRTYDTTYRRWNQWAAYSANTPVALATTDDKVQFIGSAAPTTNQFTVANANVKVSGNIMSLQSGLSGTEYTDAFVTDQTITANSAYASLFSSQVHIADASNLVLPATTLAERCYYEMFYHCTALTQAPALPALTLAGECYYDMFSGCTALTKAPALPALTLTWRCYRNMFSGCTGLLRVPALPATTLATDCYYAMFSGCTSLTAVPVLPATTMNSCCYQEMFANCTGLTTVPKNMLPATNLFSYCYKLMFSGCSSLVKAPTLPATTLATDCYLGMFKNCTSLNEVRCNATNISASGCTSDWLYNVSATGTFYGKSAAGWTSGTNGIPAGWTQHLE